MIQDNLRIRSLDVELGIRIPENFVYPTNPDQISSWIVLFSDLSKETSDPDKLRIYNAFWIAFVIFCVVFFIMAKTRTGRHIYAIGSNVEAAKLSGVNVFMTTTKTYLISAFCSFVVGLILAGQAGMGNMEAGNSYEMYGVAAGVARNSANIGCGGYYGHRMAEDNVIGIVMSNTYPCQAPFLGADRLIGTNPIIMGAPTSNPERPIVIDISTSGVAIGKVQAYRRENKQMPEGWANDYDGLPTTDPHKAYVVRPMGDHKGYGLATFVDLFGGVLAGAKVSAEIPFVENMEPEETGFAVILLDIAHFIDVDAFKAHADLLVKLLKYSRPAKGVKEIFMPGEIEARLLEENKKTGMDFSDALEAELTELAIKCGALAEGGKLEDLLA